MGSDFTGKERDQTETGLDYFGARYFSGAQGRFTIPDWSEKPQAIPYADLRNPQSLNLYAYVSNNPLNITDPNGESWITALFGAVGFVAGAIAPPLGAFWWAEGLLTGAAAAGAQYSFEKAVNSGNIAAIAGMFIGGPPSTSYAPTGPGIMPGDVWGQGQAGPFVFSLEGQRPPIHTIEGLKYTVNSISWLWAPPRKPRYVKNDVPIYGFQGMGAQVLKAAGNKAAPITNPCFWAAWTGTAAAAGGLGAGAANIADIEALASEKAGEAVTLTYQQIFRTGGQLAPKLGVLALPGAALRYAGPATARWCEQQ